MTWYCRECQTQNGPKLDHCRLCHKHWEKVWVPSRKKSRSKSRSYVKENKEESESADQWQVFPQKAPWVTSTPSRSTSYRMDVMQESCEKELTPSFQTVPEQQPSLAETSDTPMTTEETKLLEHLRGLHGMGIDLTEGMALQLEKLQTKEAKQAAGKTLSHGHLNKLNKVRAQVKTAAKKVEDLDGEWNKFVQNIVQKIQQHALMYQTCRSDMLEVFNNRLAELQAIKKEVGLASRSLLEQSGEIVSVPEIPHVADQMQQMQDMLSHVSQGDWLGRSDCRDGGGHHRGGGRQCAFQSQERITESRQISRCSIANEGCKSASQAKSRKEGKGGQVNGEQPAIGDVQEFVSDQSQCPKLVVQAFQDALNRMFAQPFTWTREPSSEDEHNPLDKLGKNVCIFWKSVF